MEDIKKDINNCGNLINKYHQHSLASKFFRSNQYAALFKSAADGLVVSPYFLFLVCFLRKEVLTASLVV